MKITAYLTAVMLFVVGISAIQPLTVETPPDVTVCEELTLKWAGGTPPYVLGVAQVLTSNLALGIFNFTTQTDTSLIWVINITGVGESPLVLLLVDSAGNRTQSLPFHVQDGTDTSCLTTSTGGTVIGPITGTRTTIPTTSTTTTTTTTTPTASAAQSTAKSTKIVEGKIWGIGLGVLAALLLLAIWRVYKLRTRRLARKYGDKENLGIDQKFQLSHLQTH